MYCTILSSFPVCSVTTILLTHFMWLPQEAYWEVKEGAEGPLRLVHTSLRTLRVPHPSAEASRRVAISHLNLLVAKLAKIAATPSIVVKSSRRGFLGYLGAFIENCEMIVWRRISICFCRHLNNWNLSIICHLITVKILTDKHSKRNLLYFCLKHPLLKWL